SQPGAAALSCRPKGGMNTMAVFRVERTRDFTVMSNHHLRDKRLTLKAKGLLSMMLSLPEDWNYSTLGLAAICREGVDAIRGALRELEKEGYVIRRQLRGPGGQIQDIEYLIYEQPPGTGSPGTGNPGTVRPCPEKSAESNMDRSSRA
ncbi:helix-turn-helix domain-containing protein, partial [Collinsella aerofaciens]